MLLLAAAGPAVSQTWDTSGNGLLNGTYYFRHVGWVGQADSANDLQFAETIYGTLTFDGNGHFTFAAAEFDTSNQAVQTITPSSGTYSLAASGYGFLSSILNSGDLVNILVSNGIIVGSSTDTGNGYNDLFVGAQLSSPAPANATFQGTYSIIGMDSPTLGIANTRAYSFPVTADGNGGIGTVNPTGYFASNSTLFRQGAISGVRYSFSGGAAVVKFGSELTVNNVNADLMAGTKYFYFSPDGNFVFGGSPTGWDFILGVRQSSTPAVKFNGLYYSAGMAQDDSPANTSGNVNLNSLYGSLNALTGGLTLNHQRILNVTPSGGGPYDFTYSDSATAGSSSSTFSDSFNQYTFGAGGAVGIGFATGSTLGVQALVLAPTLSGTGVYINPTGILHAGTLAPFTASLAPGELVSIFGTNLVSSSLGCPGPFDGTLPTTLSGVQVLVNNAPAPVYSVNHCQGYDQINAVIPITTTSLTASVQVINNGTPSNTVFNYTVQDQLGAFNSYTSIPALQHADYSMVTPSNPVKPGETILVYLTGLGTLDGSGNATENTASAACNNLPCLSAAIGGIPATIIYAGSQSTIGGGYQMNVTVPSTITTGNWFLDIAGFDSYNSEIQVPVSATGAAVQDQTLAVHRRPLKRGSSHSRQRPSKGLLPANSQ